jgi:hypothetical protein
VNWHCDSQRVSAEMEALVMWGVGREDSATASGWPSQTVSVRQTGCKQWQPGSSDDGPGRRIASDTESLQAEKSIASTFRRTGI